MTFGILMAGIGAYIAAVLVGWWWWRRRQRPRKMPPLKIELNDARWAEFLDDERH